MNMNCYTQRPGLSRRVAAIAIYALVLTTVVSSGLLLAAEDSPVLVVPPSKSTLRVAVAMPEGVAVASDKTWQLAELDGGNAKLPVQLVPAMAADGTRIANRGLILATIPPGNAADSPRRFRLQRADASSQHAFRFEPITDQSLKLSEGDRPVLVYNHRLITDERVPKSDHRRSRACYVHPVWGLDGEVLTDDFPKDHYHHHGIFWTWPHVKVDGKDHDIWAGDTIQDEFVRWIHRDVGPAAAVLAVENGWFVGDKKVMIERVWMRVHSASNRTRCLDFEFTWIPTDKPVTLQGAGGKSYGGLTVRFAPKSREDTLITVPSGRTTEDLPEKPLKWADFTSKFGNATKPSGGAIFVPTDHPNYPPTWLTRHYGAMCVGWPGVEAKTFEPGKPIRLSYRIWIHRGAVDVTTLSRAYADYLDAMKATWE